MKLQKVDPHQIKVPEIRVTAQFDEELYAQFKESIKAVGQITPPICYKVEEELVLCDGLHRIQEAIGNGDATIEVVVIPGDMIDVLTKNIFIDHLRGKTPVSEMVKVIGALYQEYNLDPEQIKEKTGLTREYIEKLIKISTASPSVQQALDQGIIGVGHAFEIARLPYPIQQDELIAKQQVYRFPVKDIKDLIDQTLREMENIATPGPAETVTEPRPIATYHCEGCKQEVEPRYLRPVMVCPTCFGEVWRLAKLRVTPEEEKVDETPTP